MALLVRSLRFKKISVSSASGAVQKKIDRTFHFTEARKALEYLATGAHFGKICLTFK